MTIDNINENIKKANELLVLISNNNKNLFCHMFGDMPSYAKFEIVKGHLGYFDGRNMGEYADVNRSLNIGNIKNYKYTLEKTPLDFIRATSCDGIIKNFIDELSNWIMYGNKIQYRLTIIDEPDDNNIYSMKDEKLLVDTAIDFGVMQSFQEFLNREEK